jgi:hypothetical protein
MLSPTISTAKFLKEKAYIIRGQKVMLEFDLTNLYQVKNKSIQRAVIRNPKRFPGDFMFRLTNKEWDDMRANIDASYLGQSEPPLAFTEAGVFMLSGVLKSKQAVEVSIQLIQALFNFTGHVRN